MISLFARQQRLRDVHVPSRPCSLCCIVHTARVSEDDDKQRRDREEREGVRDHEMSCEEPGVVQHSEVVVEEYDEPRRMRCKQQ